MSSSSFKYNQNSGDEKGEGFFRITQAVRFGFSFFLVIPVKFGRENPFSTLWAKNFMAVNAPWKLPCSAGFCWLSAIGFWPGGLGKK